MHQLVFVHGVATRQDENYDRVVANRDELFKQVLFRGSQVNVRNPHWGDLVPEIGSDIYDSGGSVRTFSVNAALGQQAAGGAGRLGGAFGAAPTPAPAPAASGASLTDQAKENPAAALDALFVEMLERHDAAGEALTNADIETFVKIAEAMEADEEAADRQQRSNNGARAMMMNIDNDDQFAAAINDMDSGPGTYGFFDGVGSAIGAITDRIRDIAAHPADILVDLVRPTIGFFIGDVFTYLREDETRTAIRGRLRDALLGAHADRGENDKLIVIGHSMGGVIMADMLLNRDAAGLPDDLTVDALFTVGSQPGFFQALGLYRPIGSNPIARPGHIGMWLNVFDTVDPLAFRADPVFSGVDDLKFNSVTGITGAHTTYFKRPQFHARARKRLKQAGVLS